MKCPVCHTKVKNKDIICPNCGFTLRKEIITKKIEDQQAQEVKESKYKQFKEFYDSMSYFQKQRFQRGVISFIILIFAC